MDEARNRRLFEILERAVPLPASERRAFLDEACAGDEQLRSEIEALLSPILEAQTLQTLPAAAAATQLGDAFATVAVAIGERRADRDYLSAGIQPGARIGSYEIQTALGRGGMGMVFKAKHRYLGRSVALKTVPPARGSDQIASQLLREAQALALLDHPNILRVHDAGVHNRSPYFVVELLRGTSLQDRLADGERLPVQRALDLMEEMASVLETHHAIGLVHRDIKPGNIWIREDGSYCLLDYGLATRSGRDSAGDQICGTPGYMSPEQARGDAVDVRSDMFQLGLVLRQCITGRRDRSQVDLRAALEAIPREELPSVAELAPDLPRGVSGLVDGLTRRAPDERYSTPRDVLRDLAELRYAGRLPSGPCTGTVFVATPFHRSFDAVLRVIHSACFANRLRARRLDRVDGVQNIWSSIEQEISDAKVVLADFSPIWPSGLPNPNVITEAAHARALGKSVLIISRGPPRNGSPSIGATLRA